MPPANEDLNNAEKILFDTGSGIDWYLPHRFGDGVRVLRLEQTTRPKKVPTYVFISFLFSCTHFYSERKINVLPISIGI